MTGLPVDPLLLPAGYGFRAITAAELAERGSLLELCSIWERPRRRARYVIGVDVSDGLGADRSVIEVLRCGTIEESAEQVAEFISEWTAPNELAPIVQALGQWYRDVDGVEAKVAVECNNHGISVQDMLQMHYGYGHFYIWEFMDARDMESRISTRIGWYTTPRTRPMLLDRLHGALTSLDPISGQPDLITHSPFLHDELKDFTSPTNHLHDAEAAKGAHDDCIMATAIANYVAWRQQAGETEPLEERRRRRREQILHNHQANATRTLHRGGAPDWRNQPATSEEHDAQVGYQGDPHGRDADPDADAILYDGIAPSDISYF